MTFPLYRRPGGVIFLDDDPDYLQMLAEVMPAGWYVRLLMSPLSCIEVLVAETALQEADAWQQQDIIKRWRDGAPLIAGILNYWQQGASARFGLTEVCVVDYAMPAMSGLQVVGELQAWPGARVLLTGRVEEQLAISAFNRGLIDKFVPKQVSDLRLRLTEAIGSLLERPRERYQQIWRATLSREQHAWLGDATLAAQLRALAEREGWIEHVVIGAPFGVLGLDRDGCASWLQLESEASLSELAEMARSAGWDSQAVQGIRAGLALVDVEVGLALGDVHQPQLQAAFRLGSSGNALYAALFRLASWNGVERADCHTEFLAARDDRALPR